MAGEQSNRTGDNRSKIASRAQHWSSFRDLSDDYVIWCDPQGGGSDGF